MMRWFALICILLASGCSSLIPAVVPPQLSFTPGEFVIIDGEYVGTQQWRIHYPDGWRVVKISIAADPVRLVFVAPDDLMLIDLSTVPLPPATPEAAQYSRADQIEIGTVTLYLSGRAPENLRADFDAAYDFVLTSASSR